VVKGKNREPVGIPTVNTPQSILENFEVKNTAMLIGKAVKMGLI